MCKHSYIFISGAKLRTKETPLEHESPTISVEGGFKLGKVYTYSYQTILHVINPAVPEDVVAVKLKALVTLAFMQTPSNLSGYPAVEVIHMKVGCLFLIQRKKIMNHQSLWK